MIMLAEEDNSTTSPATSGSSQATPDVETVPLKDPDRPVPVAQGRKLTKDEMTMVRMRYVGVRGRCSFPLTRRSLTYGPGRETT